MMPVAKPTTAASDPPFEPQPGPVPESIPPGPAGRVPWWGRWLAILTGA